jgi:multiple antibiotic resistance protein
MVIVYFIIRYIDKVEHIIGSTVIFILRKFFGVMLLAISVKMFATNLEIMIAN